MRYLEVGGVVNELTDEKAEKLIGSGAIYPCGDEHDLHLNPDHSFTLEEVELLLSAND